MPTEDDIAELFASDRPASQAARRTIRGYEAINILRKGQVRRVSGKDVGRQNRFINQLFDLAA